jgi:threonine dehydratase
MRSLLDGLITVSESELRRAVAHLARHGRLIAEPAGAAATAAYLSHGDELPPGRTVAVVSGGNIEPVLLAEILGEDGFIGD